jgi:peptide/nickel transport system substrate-binding protein
MNRRGRLGRMIVALVVGLMLVATACGGGGDDGGGGPTGDGNEGPSGTPKRGGTLRYGLEAETDGLNPTTNRFAIAAYMMGGAVFDRLALRDKGLEVKPYLAESITPNDDYSVWTVKLRPGIKFHDGEPLNSEALRVHVEAFLADPLISIAAKPILAPTNQIEIVDDLTARLHLSGPNTRFPLYLTSQLGMVGSPKWLTAAKANPDLNQQPVGTGPFKFKSRTQDGSTSFVRNEDYWNKDVEVYLDEIEFVIQTDPARRADQLVSGELDVMHTSDPETIERLRNESGVNTFEESRGEEGFVMINSQQPPFDDIRARKALTLATPKQDYLELIGQGVLKSAESMFNSDQPYYNPDVKQEADDPEGARELAADFCADKPDLCSNGKIKMKFKYTGPSAANQDVADTLMGGWDDVFEIETDQVLQDDYIIQVAFGDYQVVTWRQFGSDDPEGEFVWLDCRNVGQPGALGINWPRICNQERQSLLEAQRKSLDEAEIEEAWKKITETINEDYVYVFLGNTVWEIAANDDVGDVIESKHPGGGVTGLAAGGYHTVLQMWLDR